MSDSSSSSSSPDRGGSIAAIVVAGGTGRRMGEGAGGVPKQFLEVAGVPILLHALRAFTSHPRIRSMVVVLPAAHAAAPPAWLDGLAITIVAGGRERGDSVRAGLQVLSTEIETVLVHDGARPFVSRDVIDRVIAAAADSGAVAALRVTDTIKEASPDGTVGCTVDRSRLWRAQTPQGFPLALLRDVYDRARRDGVTATDDAALFEHYRLPVRVVEGADENFKVTRPFDLVIGEAVARGLLA